MKEIRLSYRHTIAACSIGYVVQAVVNNFLPLLFLTFRSEYGFSLKAISGLIALNFGVQLLVDYLSARVIDKIGYRNTMLIGHLFSVIGFLALAFLPDILPVPYVGVVLSVICYAIGGGIMEVLVSPIVEACPTENKAGAMSLLHSFYCWGHVAVVVISTVFFAIAGIENWRIMAAVWAFLPAFNTLYFLLVPINTPVEEGQGMKVRELAQNPVFWILFLLMFCSGAAELSMSQWASAFAEDALGVSKVIGDLTGPCLFAICMGTSRVLYSRLSEKIRLQRTMIYSLALGVTAYLLAIVSGNAVISLVGCAMVGFSVGILWPGTFSLASAKLPTGGTAMFALLALAGDLGCGGGPALVGIVSGLANDNIKKGLFIALIFPVAMIITIMMVNKKLATKILSEKKTWIGIAACALLVVGASFTSGCKGKDVVPTPTPTPYVIGQVTPATATEAPKATDTPTPTATEAPKATDTPVPTATETPKATATPTPTRKPTATPTPTQAGFKGVTITEASGTGYVTADSLNVRKGPGTTYEAIGGLKNNDTVTITGKCSNGWIEISFDGGKAYVHGDYISDKKGNVTNTPAPTATPTATSKPTATPTPTQKITPVTPTTAPTATSKPTATPTPTAAVTPTFSAYVDFTGEAYIVIDAKTGKTLYAKNENKQWSPASLTKMMTAIVAYDQFEMSEYSSTYYESLHWSDVKYEGETVAGDDTEMVTLVNLLKSKGYSAEEWTTSSYTLEQRLYQMLLASAADAAENIALMGEESIDFFMYMMVADKCNELGLTNTKLNNPVGADESCGAQYKGNVSTAADLAKIAKALMDTPELREIVGTKVYSIPKSGKIGAMTVTNTHPMYDAKYSSTLYEVIGIKTGFTDVAGSNLATAAVGKDGREVIIITLGCKNHATSADQTKKMLDYIFTYTK